MSTAVAPGQVVASRRRAGTAAVVRWEVAKLRAQPHTRAVIALALAVPFLFVVVLSLQSSVPHDTLFGRWVHESGFAVPLVILNFAGQWGLPLLVGVVAGDIFSAEDHHGTWKTVLTRSAARGQLFTGKVIAVLGYALALVVALAVASTAAGLLVGRQPLVGLSGQLVPAGRALPLVLESWAVAILPTVAFAAVAVVTSVVTRSSVAGIGAPVVLGLAMQLVALVNGPQLLQTLMLSTALLGWHGLWTTPGFTGPLWQGVVVSLVWTLVCGVVAAVTFARRDIVVA